MAPRRRAAVLPGAPLGRRRGLRRGDRRSAVRTGRLDALSPPGRTSAADLAAARAAELETARRAASDARAIEDGWILRHAALPDSWELNRVHLTGPAPDSVAALEALADRALDGLAHRRVACDDPAGAEALAGALESRGWHTARRLLMGLAGGGRGAAPDPRARVISEAELVTVQRDVFTELAGSRELGDRTAAGAAALRAHTEAVGLGAGEGDGLAACATLFLHPALTGRRVARLDAVGTLAARRERGLARATVSAALAAAVDWGAELVVLATDAEDWPQLMYHALGFRALGRQLMFDRLGSAGGRR